MIVLKIRQDNLERRCVVKTADKKEEKPKENKGGSICSGCTQCLDGGAGCPGAINLFN